MRLQENGPEIPESLMAARDEGRVVFFCGAGVSVPAGYPNFLDLTLEVMKRLGVSSRVDNQLFAYRTMVEDACNSVNSTKQKLPFSFDQVFYLLQQEYGSAAVEREVSFVLKEKKTPFTDYHKVILRLSRGISQTPQVVTTNFDLLFEHAQKGVKTHIQPALPDLNVGVAPEGVIYLHGRLSGRSRSGGQSNLIISSADFGRAYLADGWASRFIKALASQYIIVLLGYSAEDPPVKYLLEGLHAKNGNSTGSIFAFERGTQESVDQNWRHRGVTGIAYSNYDDLWNSLSAWADYSENPAIWRADILKLAQKSPRELSAFEREQVAHLLSSASGAEEFYNSCPSPSGEWLCVFDPNVRNMEGKFVRRYPESLSYNFSPQETYGILGDPVVDYKSNDIQYLGVNFLSLLSSDNYMFDKSKASLAGAAMQELPARLKFIAAWIVKNLHDPWALWWAAGKANLHPHLLRLVEHKLGRNDHELPRRMARDWGVLIAEHEDKSNFGFDIRWYQFKEIVSSHGWGFLAFRYLEKAIQPALKIKRRSRLPLLEVAEGVELVELDLTFVSLHGEEFEMPDQDLVAVVSLWRTALIKASNLALEVVHFTAPNLFRDKEEYLDEEAFEFVSTYSKLYGKLAAYNSYGAKSEFLCWPKNDQYFFPQLRIFALSCPGLFDASEIAENLLALNDDEFWRLEYRQKLLSILKANWGRFAVKEKNKLERRIVSGPNIDTSDVYAERNNMYAVLELLGGMSREGCSLTKASTIKLNELRSLEGWDESIENGSFRKTVGRSGWVKTDKDASLLIDCALNEVVKLALTPFPRDFSEFVERRPFGGLVLERPLRALKSLFLETKSNFYPSALWEELLVGWPQNDLRLTMHVAKRLILLPSVEIAKMSQVFTQWMENNLKTIYESDSGFGLSIWDSAVDLLINAGDTALLSTHDIGIVSSRVPSRPVRTIERSQASPMGRMTETLFMMVDCSRPKQGGGMPSGLRVRLNRLLSLDLKCLQHIISIVSFRTEWLFWVEPIWAKEKIIPLFSIENEFSEVVWDGRLHDNRHFQPLLFVEVKENFIALFGRVQEWGWGGERSRILHQHLLLACEYGVREGQGLSFQEVREVLQTTDDAGRIEALRFLSTMLRSKTKRNRFVKVFLEKAWPRELRYLSGDTTRCFINLADKASASFPEIVNRILPLLTVMKRCDSIFFYSHNKADASLSSQFPVQMLALLDKILASNSIPPYEFGKMLAQIIEARPQLARDKRFIRLRQISIENI